MAVLRLFASARDAAGTGQIDLPGTTVEEVLDQARAQLGEGLAALLPSCAIWRNGEPCDPADPVSDADEVAVLPPVSGGCS